ncbi:MAG: glycosyltransferase family 39 protein, partial [Candidatus Micrarchaeaceae archaeon]
MFGAGTEEYLMTLGVLAAFIGTLVSGILSRHSIGKLLKNMQLNRWHMLMAVAILALFVILEATIVKPTQQLFFDDVIYQGGALDLLHMGQAWMCNYGTPTSCILGQVFHEPVGTALNIAIGFALFGVRQATAFNTMFALTALSVLLTFFVALLLFRNTKAALFSELFMALSPALLVWARPTTSDIPSLAYTLLAMFALVVFVREKNIRTFTFFGMATVLATYMR